jgi:flavin reductase (DIM6/NTAB) family NADH-FMN oxidoreductase RutF
MNAVHTPADIVGLERRVSLFKDAMRRLASGVSLVTSGTRDGDHAGLIATSVVSVSMDPPTLLVCVNQSSSAHPVIDASGVFCVNLLASEDRGLVDIFGTSARRAERFKVGAFEPTGSGPLRLATALAAIECKVVEAFAYGTHTLFVGEVTGIHLAPADRTDPLVYMNKTFHALSSPDQDDALPRAPAGHTAR